jgi:ribosomal protein S7
LCQNEEKKKRTMESTKKRVNALVKSGKKSVGERWVQDCIVEMDRREKNRTGEEIRSSILERLKPIIETKSVKQGGMAKQIPMPVTHGRGRHKVCRWIRQSTRKRVKKRGIPFEVARRMERMGVYEELSRVQREELKDVKEGVKRQTEPMQMREQRHRAAKANRVFVS